MNKVLLKDSFEFKTVPFLVKVERKDMFVNGDSGEIKGINIHNAPSGYDKKPSKSWVICDCLIARVRPDYPYTIKDEWPENVDKHFHTVELLEVPSKSKGLIFSKWDTEPNQDLDDVNIREMAEKTILKMKKAYIERTKVKSLN